MKPVALSLRRKLGFSSTQGQAILLLFLALISPSEAVDSVQPPSQVRLGMMMAMFRPQRLNYRRAGGWADSTRSATMMGLREINNKSDGLSDWLLPRTRLLLSFADSRCDGGYGVSAVLQLKDAFQGRGVSGIIGPGCASAATTASTVTDSTQVPMISSGATSPLLSDGSTYRYFLRTVPVNSFRGEGIVDMLRNLFNYTAVAVVWTSANSGESNMVGVRKAAEAQSLDLQEFLLLTEDSLPAVDRVCRDLDKSRKRIIVLMLSTILSKTFIRRAWEEHALGGQGFLWFGLQTLSDLGDGAATSLLKGYFALALSGGEGPLFEAYQQRVLDQASTAGADGACSGETDDDGNFLWGGDHDHNVRAADSQTRIAQDSATDASDAMPTPVTGHNTHRLLGGRPH
jgi:hypothetical protein